VREQKDLLGFLSRVGRVSALVCAGLSRDDEAHSLIDWKYFFIDRDRQTTF
jgi:hypothetical protein